LARACGSYPQCPEFESLRRHQLKQQPLNRGFIYVGSL
jgi:hypothetical protein